MGNIVDLTIVELCPVLPTKLHFLQTEVRSMARLVHMRNFMKGNIHKVCNNHTAFPRQVIVEDSGVEQEVNAVWVLYAAGLCVSVKDETKLYQLVLVVKFSRRVETETRNTYGLCVTLEHNQLGVGESG